MQELKASIDSIISNNQPIKKKKFLLKFLVYFIIFSIIGFIIFSSQVLILEQRTDSWFYQLPVIGQISGQIKYLAKNTDRTLIGENRDRINLLLLGMGGKKHQGEYLTDTIILMSIQPSTKRISMISIPRDLTVPVEGLGWQKINNINAYAEIKTKNSGGAAISHALSDILKIPIDYFIRIDFEGFINIVNAFNGIEIYVENTLEDYAYPIYGREKIDPYELRFEHLLIKKGWQKMNGELALKYARSRHAYGVEGSDFARAKRQQKILIALKNKILSKYILFKPQLIINIINELREHLNTNLQIWEIIQLWNLIKNVKQENIINKVLDDGPFGLLTSMITKDGAYILTPRKGNFTEIQNLVHNIFEENIEDIKEETQQQTIIEQASVEIRNGTWINGLANKVALELKKYQFNIIRIGNASKQNFQKSVIYDLTYGTKQKALAILKQQTNANIAFTLPDWLINDISTDIANEKIFEQPDFILVLGTDITDIETK